MNYYKKYVLHSECVTKWCQKQGVFQKEESPRRDKNQERCGPDNLEILMISMTLG